MQLDMFESETFQSMRLEIVSLKELLLKCNRSAQGKIGKLEKEIIALKGEQQEIKQIQARKKADLIPFFGELLEVSK